MFDTMTLTKLGGGLFGSLLIFMLGGWLAETIYVTAEYGYGERQQAYTIEVEGDETGAEPEIEVDQAALFAAAWPVADAAEGVGEFRACAACHAIAADEQKVGPSMHGVVDRAVGSVAAFGGYSGALSAAFDVWTPENLNLFLLHPKVAAEGTSMNYGGIEDVQDRANLIAYLATLDG